LIFYNDKEQKTAAMASKEQLMKTGRFDQVATKIQPAVTFYPAEDYHQHYSDKNPAAYDAYRTGCRRDARSREVWGN
jgi:peptide methionine sulfoxide reductase MsrA